MCNSILTFALYGPYSAFFISTWRIMYLFVVSLLNQKVSNLRTDILFTIVYAQDLESACHVIVLKYPFREVPHPPANQSTGPSILPDIYPLSTNHGLGTWPT